MAETPESAIKALKLASAVGGADGRLLAQSVDEALNAPDLREYTQIGTIIQSALGSLGTYDPNRIPYGTKCEMRRDPQIRFGLQSVKSPLVAAPLHFVSRSREVQALLTDVFITSGFLSELLISSLQAIDFGFAAHEQLWTLEDERSIEYEKPKGDGRSSVEEKKYTKLFTPERFKDLDPGLVALLKDHQGKFVGLTFGAWAAPTPTPADVMAAVKANKTNIIKASKCFLFTPICEFQNIRGEGRLEWTYDSWYWQRICYMVAMRWYERKADPPYVIYAPNTTGIDAEETTTVQKSNLVLASNAVAKLRSTGHVALPSEVFMDDEGKPSAVRAWELREVKVQDMHPAFLEMIDHFDKKKTRSVFASDIALARSRQAGTLGSTEAILDATITMQNQTLEAWVNAVNRYVVQPFLRYNNIKDKAVLTSTGVLSDNRDALRETLNKVLEADMLAEQAWGRSFPNSLTQLIDREGLVRELGIPHRPIDPDMEMPKPAPVDGPTARDNLSNRPDSSARRGTGGGTAKPGKAAKQAEFRPFWQGEEGYKMDFASNALVRSGQREAEGTEEWVRQAGSEMEARKTLETHEKAAIAIALWWLLRSPKSKDGKRVAGDRSVDTLVFAGGRGKVLPAATLAANLPELERKASALEGQGMTLHPDQPQPIINRARTAMSVTFAGLPNEVRQSNLNLYLSEAVRQGQLATEGILNRFALQDATFRALAEEAVQRIIFDNTEGLILNIENIARRNAQNMVERFLMGAGRELGVEMGLVADALNFKFNRLYSDLSLEAHLRAAYRRAHVESARENGLHFFVKIPVIADEPGPFDYVVGSHDFWVGVGERHGAPMPHVSYGLHHGSKSYWIAVPTSQRVREPTPLD